MYYSSNYDVWFLHSKMESIISMLCIQVLEGRIMSQTTPNSLRFQFHSLAIDVALCS